MNRNQLIGLSAAAVLIAVLALIVGNVRSGKHEASMTSRLYPDLESQLNDITRVGVHSAGEAQVTIEREENQWKVKEKGGYPADFGRLRESLIGLAKLELIEAKTSKPEHYARLGVQDIEEAEADAQQVQLWGEDETQLADVIVGKTDSSGGSYVRKANETRSWLGSQRLTFPTKVEDWLDKTLIDLDIKRIHRIDIKAGEDPEYAIIKADSSNTEFELESPSEGERVKAGEPRRIASALSNLNLVDVSPDSKVPKSDVPWHVAIFKTSDGLIIEARTRTAEDKNYLKLAARYDASLAEPNDDSGSQEASADSEATEVGSKSDESEPDVEAEAQELQTRFEGWTFIIPSYQGSALRLTREDLIEKDEEVKDQDKDSGDSE